MSVLGSGSPGNLNRMDIHYVLGPSGEDCNQPPGNCIMPTIEGIDGGKVGVHNPESHQPGNNGQVNPLKADDFQLDADVRSKKQITSHLHQGQHKIPPGPQHQQGFTAGNIWLSYKPTYVPTAATKVSGDPSGIGTFSLAHPRVSQGDGTDDNRPDNTESNTEIPKPMNSIPTDNSESVKNESGHSRPKDSGSLEVNFGTPYSECEERVAQNSQAQHKSDLRDTFDNLAKNISRRSNDESSNSSG
ncbi:hypothetical protein IWQ61_010374, partial [Dispira simplex]